MAVCWRHHVYCLTICSSIVESLPVNHTHGYESYLCWQNWFPTCGNYKRGMAENGSITWWPNCYDVTTAVPWLVNSVGIQSFLRKFPKHLSLIVVSRFSNQYVQFPCTVPWHMQHASAGISIMYLNCFLGRYPTWIWNTKGRKAEEWLLWGTPGLGSEYWRANSSGHVECIWRMSFLELCSANILLVPVHFLGKRFSGSYILRCSSSNITEDRRGK